MGKKKRIEKTIKAAVDVGKYRDDDSLFHYDDGIMSHIDCVFMAPEDYKALYGTRRCCDSVKRKRLAVVKIMYKDESGKTHAIHRRYEGCCKLCHTDTVALNYSSLNELLSAEVSDILGKKVILTEGSTFLYYWNHPFHATRISTRLGWASLALSVLSLFMTLLKFQ